METLEKLAAGNLMEVMISYRDVLRTYQEPINRLNVFPVPDGDTGTNMALTLESVVEELRALNGTDGREPTMTEICQAISHGSLMGARGNSGVILSQILRGATSVIRPFEAVGGREIGSALVQASESARSAVMRPVEGTILTVAHCAAVAANGKAEVPKATLAEVVQAAREAGAEALARTPDLLPVLKQAGVVDAGGAGFLLMLDVFWQVITGCQAPELPLAARTGPLTVGSPAQSRPSAPGHQTPGNGVVGGLRYEVMYLLEVPDESVPAFKDVWAGLGDSIVVVGGEGMWSCHIHTNDVGAAIEAALDAGRPRQIRVVDLGEEIEEERWVREAVSEGPDEQHGAPGPVPTSSAVAVATGEGIGRIFWSLGVHKIVAGGQSMNPSTAQILEAVEEVPGAEVVVLPNNKNIVPVAEQVDGLTAKKVRVVPTHNIAQGFAALLQFDPQADGEVNLRAMSEAATRVVSGEVTRAVRDSVCNAGPIGEGDWLGLSAQGIEVIGDSLAGVGCSLLDKLVGPEHEIVTVIEGEGTNPADTRRITEWLSENRPEAVPEVHSGGQPLYAYLFSIE